MTNTPNNLSTMLDALLAIEADTSLDDGTLTELAQRYDLATRAASVLEAIVVRLSNAVAERMENDEMEVAGVGKLARKPRTSSVWIDDTSRERMLEDTINAIVRRVAVDPASGEVHQPLAMVAREVWRLTNDAFSFTADPKVPFRKVLGLRPDEYRSKRVTGYRVTVEG